jgi:predicted metal-dependent phosphotriesterase family hydrolase
MYEILDILHGKNVVLATGHVSAKEAVTLVREVKQRGYDIRILINHVLFYTPDMDENDIETLKDPGVWFEISHLTQKIHAASMDRLTRMITRHPDANWVMVSDAGQKGNPSPQALRQFRDQLTSRHISDQTIEKMMVHNPRSLLY